ncbi:MarR family winged helix-turn-helix transcriptional regulator [Pseudofrankia sp. BMG5.37]|uniref:MarR family winged helix-turn-helix transcriptional regulator n=1 Tax=Pseudofrankia sp. BMG5.37 TaxID=3050035 RepID=UPI0028947C3F|nr:MarR family winged helix-turn-helix transcriptional regulator [Pseudofrankia sp. BMG5.37]MDT3441609.1 MarR family winged helix-turn-helix transcriptional regulator [Pseudofrankia sp. BMG5.37]
MGESCAPAGGVAAAATDTVGATAAEGLAASWPARVRGLAGWLVNKTAVHSHRLTAEAFTAVGGRRFHYALLASLEEFGSSSQADLGRHCGFDRSDVATMVNELVQAGHVERAQDPADRRRNIIAITPAGRSRLADFDVVAADLQDVFLAPLDTQERAELIRLLTRVLEHHTALHGFAREPHPGA